MQVPKIGSTFLNRGELIYKMVSEGWDYLGEYQSQNQQWFQFQKGNRVYHVALTEKEDYVEVVDTLVDTERR